jgi:hypothetical protein
MEKYIKYAVHYIKNISGLFIYVLNSLLEKIKYVFINSKHIYAKFPHILELNIILSVNR